MPSFEKKIKLDQIDKVIVSILTKDCNTPSWKIADTVKISDVAVRKRIKKLIKNKIILGYQTMIDLTKLGYQVHDLYVKTNFISKHQENHLFSYLESNRKITYAVRTIGEYDLIITIVVKNNLELKEYIQNLRNKFPDIISSIVSQPLFETIYHTQLAEDFLE